ncbi:DUF5681 domain-containing protein [Rhodoblastus sp.]|uniref:DUF5681 domain-containing protein n=1 Tax=Rhodoblastus sp. TaxID=1962975 RepID=UPI003F9A4906
MKHTNESGDRQVADEDYAVGYGRPPKDHQFKKGRSGNPAGRPKRKDEGRLKMIDVLMEPRAAKINGKTRRMPCRRTAVSGADGESLSGQFPGHENAAGPDVKMGRAGHDRGHAGFRCFRR